MLATIVVGTVLSVTFGILAAVGGLPDLHQRWMLLCYGGDQAGEHDSPLLTGAPLSPATPP